MKEPKNTSGPTICLLRKQLRLSRDELGARVGVKGKQIGRYERGERYVDSERLRLIAAALSVPVGDLFEGATDPHSREDAPSGPLDALENQQSTRMAEAFIKVADPNVRDYLIHLAERFAEDPSLYPIGWKKTSER